MSVKLILWSCSVLLAATLTVAAQTDTRGVSLLVVECGSIAGVCEKEHLLRFRFKNGELISKETVLTSDALRVRYDLGKNHIYQNRYVITNWGDVVDTQKNELLHEGDGEYIGAEGNRIIQHINKSDLRGYFYFDIQKKKYARLRVPGKWALPGLLSPDQTRSVQGGAFSIWLYGLNGKRKLLGSNFLTQGDTRSSFGSAPPLFWLDNNRILTQTDNGQVVIVQVDGTITPVVTIPISEPSLYQPYFFRDGEGRIVYECSGKSFAIDVARKSYSPYEWVALGSGFEAESKRNPAYGHIINHRGKEIGRLWASVWQAPTIDGYLALEYGDVGSNPGYPKGLLVWSSASSQWITLDVNLPIAIIGWIEE